MPSWIIALLVGVSLAGWSYNKLAHANGNPSPRSNMIAASVAGFLMFLFILSLLKLVFGF